MIELLPCPFCGGQAELISTDIFEPSFAMSVRCTDCHTGTLYYTYNDTDGLQDAIDVMRDLWNSRVGRTCKNEDKYADAGFFICGNCGFGENGIELTPNYCPNCGAKVVGE